MIKKYVITFSISVLVLFSTSVILLMIMIPQEQTAVTGTTGKYEKVNTADYQFEQTKDITKETLMKEYTIDASDISTFKKYNQYKAGNSDPFTPQTDLTDTPNGKDLDKTKNGNGGIPIPPATIK